MAENSARSQCGVIRFLSSSPSCLVHANLMSLLAFAISIIYRISKNHSERHVQFSFRF